MNHSLTLREGGWPRVLSLLAGLGMAVSSAMTIQHYFAANYPESIWEGSFCDISAFFNCDSSAFAAISQIGGVPIGFFGLMVGGLVALGALFPSASLERTNKTIALANIVGVVALLFYSVLFLGTLCLLCAGFYLFSAMNLYLFWRYGIDRTEESIWRRHFRPSLKIVATFGVVTLVGAYGMALFHDAKQDAQSGGVAARIVEEYYSLPTVDNPSFLSPFWTIRSTEAFEDATIRIVNYVDLLCPDCLFLAQQMERLAGEFEGKINVALQFFPLEAACNDVVEKDLHPGACDLSYIAAHDPDAFNQIHDEIFANFRQARDPQWREELARRYGVEDALEDADTRALVHRIIQTGAEYEKTSDRYSHGIRSTPTMIINNRMVIGTFPDEQLRAIFRALVAEHESGEKPTFMENWVPRR